MGFLKEYGTAEGPLGFPMNDRAAHGLEILLRNLPKDPDYAYHRTTIAKDAPTTLSVPDRWDVSWISTECLDRDKEIVIAKGMMDGTFALNPIVTLNHKYDQPPVARSVQRWRAKEGDQVGIKAKTVYPARPADWPAATDWPPDIAFRLVSGGLLNGKSIGFQPLKIHRADAKEAQKKGWPEGVRVIDEWLLLEYACVYLPANQEAVVQSISKGLIPAAMAAALAIKASSAQTPAPIHFITEEEMIKQADPLIKSAIAQMLVKATAQIPTMIKEAIERLQGRV